MRNGISALCSMIALCASALACAAAELTPNDFAYGMPLQLQGDAAIYTLSVPKEVYQHTVRADLGDMRIFNGDGEWVTYSLSTPVSKSNDAPLIAIPIFPLHGDGERALDRVKITIASEQGDVHLQTSGKATTALVQAYVLDVRKLNQPLRALELRWADDAAEFSGSVSVESSNDLGVWSSVANNLPIVNLKFGDQQLQQNRVEFTAIKAKYLRLRWNDRPAPFVLSEVLAEAAPTVTEAARMHADAGGRAVADAAATYEFALDFHAPIDRINIKLSQLNTLATVSLSSRAQATQPWRDVTTLRVYDLQNNGTSLRNAALMIPANTDRYWRMQAHTAGGLGKDAPALQVAWIPQELTFVARGHAPFQLAFGNASARAATSPLQSLLADPATVISVGMASAGQLHELGGVKQLIAKRELPWKTWSLWLVLIVAVGVLGTVAYRLFREMSE
jgi:hypothetical protein